MKTMTETKTKENENENRKITKNDIVGLINKYSKILLEFGNYDSKNQTMEDYIEQCLMQFNNNKLEFNREYKKMIKTYETNNIHNANNIGANNEINIVEKQFEVLENQMKTIAIKLAANLEKVKKQSFEIKLNEIKEKNK